jgi:hypothetical protein
LEMGFSLLGKGKRERTRCRWVSLKLEVTFPMDERLKPTDHMLGLTSSCGVKWGKVGHVA